MDVWKVARVELMAEEDCGHCKRKGIAKCRARIAKFKLVGSLCWKDVVYELNGAD
jgi:hypothetical protein